MSERLITADGVEVAEGQTVWYYNLGMLLPEKYPASPVTVRLCYSTASNAVGPYYREVLGDIESCRRQMARLNAKADQMAAMLDEWQANGQPA